MTRAHQVAGGVYSLGDMPKVSGDALVTMHPLSGARGGPQTLGSTFDFDPHQAQESLVRLDGVEANVVLPGHGEPWRGGVAAAVAEARRRGGR